MTDYLDDNLLETDEAQFFDFVKQVYDTSIKLIEMYYDRIDLSKGIETDKSNNIKSVFSDTNGFFIMGFTFRILFLMLVMI